MVQKTVSILIMMLGVTVIYAWYTHNPVLLQINQNYAPMQFNTALGFVLSGAGLFTLRYNNQMLQMVFGALIAALGTISLLQYLYEFDAGIDEFFIKSDITTRTSHPGRMAPNTALCFILVGFAMMLAQMKRALTFNLTITLTLLAALSLAGYAINIEKFYGWGSFTRMALHTAVGFVIIGASLASYCISKQTSAKKGFLDLIPYASATALAVLAFFVLFIFKEQSSAHNQTHFNTLVQDTHNAIQQRYKLYDESLISGLGLYYASDNVQRNEWKRYVSSLNIDKTMPGINGIGYIDYVHEKDLTEYLRQARADDAPDFKNHPNTSFKDKFIIKFIEPYKNNKEAVGLDIGFETNRRDAAERARDTGASAITRKILLVQDHQRQPGFLHLIPVYKTKSTPETVEERRKQLQGWVYAPFIGPNFFKGINEENNNQLDFTVYDGNEIDTDHIIFTSNPDSNVTNHENAKHMTLRTELNFAGSTWVILWRENTTFVPLTNPTLGYILLSCGLIFAIGLFFILEKLIHINEEISRRVHEQTEKLKNEAEFRGIIGNTIPDLLFVKDRKFRIVEANDAFLGYYPEETREDVIGSTTLEEYDPKEAEEFLRHDKIAFEQGYSEAEEILTMPNGQTRVMYTKKVRFTNNQGEPFILGISRDITEAKESQEFILKTNKELERSNIELERFAHIASHDLQEPLRKITSFITELEEHLGDKLDEDAKLYINFITSGANRMRDLVTGLLKYSTVNKSEPDIQSLDSNEIVAIAVDNLSERIKENDAKITYKELPKVYYDHVMLTQVFQNLIGNAIKYRSDRTPEINISATKLADCWEFSVEDNGMGIEEKYLDRIFDMFQRLHRKEDIPGTGIGLSLCQKIVERYGGIMWVESEPGLGSTFFFTIPVKKSYVISAASGYAAGGI